MKRKLSAFYFIIILPKVMFLNVFGFMIKTKIRKYCELNKYTENIIKKIEVCNKVGEKLSISVFKSVLLFVF